MDISSTPAQQASLPPAATPQETSNTKGVSRLREHVHYVMRDLVMGLAKSVVAGAVTKALSVIEEETKMTLRLQRDLVFITGEFEMMQSFLNVVDEERVKNKVVRTWVRQIRDLALDMDDLMEFIVHMDRTNGWFILLPPCMAPAQPLDMAVFELKARVEDVSTRNTRYNLISVHAQQQPAPRTGVGYDTKRQHFLGDLTQLITKEEDADLQVISVWGADGGIGTTSIIRKSYSDPKISNSFTCRAWVSLRHPFKWGGPRVKNTWCHTSKFYIFLLKIRGVTHYK
jgi:hypothetical protein